MRKLFFYIILLLSSPFSCSESTSVIQSEVKAASSDYLVSTENITKVSRQDLIERSNNLGSKEQILYDIQVVRVVYNTRDTEGNSIQASGAVLYPIASDHSFPLLSHQHGTILQNERAPSYYGPGSEVYNIGSIIAGMGYVVSAPDYLGYGESKDIKHPYEHASSLAGASLDMLRAVREFANQNDSVSLNNKVFLAGYSEGGFATMALMKEIEQNHGDEFTVTASAPGAGAYNKKTFAQNILSQNKPLSFINSYLWVMDTYNRVYDINRPYSYYLKKPYDSIISHGGVFASVETNPQLLFTDQFRKGVLEETDSLFLHALKDNSIHDWKPTAPLNLIHGTNDNFVPFFNSEQAYDAMTARGASNIQLTPIKGEDHRSSINPYGEKILKYFSKYH